jgi:pyruvate formate lyase activating enzyme
MGNNNHHNNPNGLIAEIQRMSTDDGPGLRTTVFFKGCGLRCTWCHNPECISSKPQINWIETRCIGCQTCREVCPEAALNSSDDGVSIDRKQCNACGLCAEECPSTALELIGRSWRSRDLLEVLAKDRVYFEKSDGGVTLSGGDPAIQAPFAAALLKALKQAGIQTAIDTCGVCTQGALDLMLPHADLVLYDIKEIDPVKHKIFTGKSVSEILERLVFICRYMDSHPGPDRLWIRTPIIPGATAREVNIHGIGEFISANIAPSVDRWELCAFNNLCRDKYRRLGLTWEFADSELMRKSAMEELAAVARNSGVDPDIVHWSGSTRIEDDDCQNGNENIF